MNEKSMGRLSCFWFNDIWYCRYMPTSDAVDETASGGSDPEQASRVFSCKQLRLNDKKLSGKKRNGSKRFRRSPTC